MNRDDIIIIHGTNYKEMAKQVLECHRSADQRVDRKKRVA